MDEKPPKVAELVRDGIASAKAAAEAALDADATSLYAIVVDKLRAGNQVAFVDGACTMVVLAPVNAARFAGDGYSDAIRSRLERHFDVENVQLTFLGMEDVGCGAIYRETQRTDDCCGMCCVTSVFFCCIPLFCYWLPLSLYVRQRFLCRYTVRLAAKL